MISSNGRRRVMFALLCLTWGATWLAMKIGITAVPPAFFSGVRWSTAGLLLLIWQQTGGRRFRIPARMGWRFVIVAFLMVVLNPIVMLYGLRLVGSGLASVISAGTTPLSLLAFSVAARQERFNRSHLAALGLGVAGIALLFGPKAMAGHLDRHEAIGALCVLLGTLSYNAASVISRPLMRNMSPAEVAGGTNFCGGIALLILALLFEPGARQAASLDWGLAPWLAWVFLVLCSSIGATIIYLMLVRDWGASRTGTYAFVSPVIAVLLGVAVLGETLDVVEIMGMALMLTAAGLVLRRKQPG